MKIAVLNAGSSSLKFKLFNTKDMFVIDDILIQNIGKNGLTHHNAILDIIQRLKSQGIDIKSLDAIVHRVVHGGEDFQEPTIIDKDVIKKIKKLIPLAPLHNNINLEGIELAIKFAPNVQQIAVFDTAFHSTMPKKSYLYALDYELYEKHKIRKYGFHGSSHSYIAKQTAKILNKDIDKLNIISLHLGNGASVCAIKNGKSIDTSMGFTPLEGLIMGTRCGSIDSAIVFYLYRELGLSIDEIDNLLNKKSGLIGICGLSDVREILDAKTQNATLAIEMMIKSIQKYIGSYMILLEDVDAIVFTGGIGENSSYIRNKVMDNKILKEIKSLVIKTDEELEMINECLRVIN